MLSILLVSGNQRNADEISVILRKYYRLLSAEDASGALKILHSTPVDAIIVDSIVRTNDGFDCISHIREVFAEIPIIFILSDQKSVVRKRAASLGIFACVSPPFEEESILIITEKAVERHRLMSDLKYYKSRSNTQFKEAGTAPMANIDRKMSAFHAEVLRKLAKAITSVHDLDSLLLLLCNAVSEIFGASASLVFTLKPGTDQYEPSAMVGADRNLLKDVRFGADSALLRWFYENNQIFRKENPGVLLSESAYGVLQETRPLRSEVIAPLFSQGELLGFISLGKRTTGLPYSEEDIELLAMMSLYTGTALRNALDYKKINYDKVLNESILRNIRTGIISVDTEGRITGINPFAEKLLKFETGKVIGEDIQQAGSVLADMLLRTLRTHTLYAHHEAREPVSKTTIAVSTSLLRNEQDQIIGAIAFFTDLSQVKELQSSIEHLKKAEFWSELSARMAHEIRNPLTSIKTFTQLFPERYNEAEFRDNFIQIVGKEIDKIDSITDQLVMYSKPFRGELRPIEVNGLLNELINAFSEAFKQKNLTIRRNPAPEIIKVKGNRDMLFEAFSRIIQNSVDFAAENTELSIEIRMRTSVDLRKMPQAATVSGNILPEVENESANGGHYVELEFKDNGPGIPEENIARIFTPFFSTKVKGIGLGLAIVDKTIQQHHGRIELDSKVGAGTCIRIFLPAYLEV